MIKSKDMETPEDVRKYLNPVFSLLDDGNPNVAGIESLPIFVEEDDAASKTRIGWESELEAEHTSEEGD